HFYYDGFIWKVRERSTRQSLGLAGGTTDPAPAGLGGFLPSWTLHGLRWDAVFVLPLSALWFWQTHLSVPELQRRAWLAADVPNGAKQHFDYGSLLQRLGRGDEAGPHYEAAARLLPDSPEAHYNYASFLASTGKGNDSVSELQRVVQLKPDYLDVQLRLADALFAKGNLEE